jgi:pyruvate dehydrogenase E1 component alpha subunit
MATKELSLQLYRSMQLIRLTEEEIAARYSEQEMRCPTHLYIGQEAVAAGISAHLTPTDYIMSTHRSHGHYLAKGGDLKAFIAELYGRDTGCSRGKGGSMHLIDLKAGVLGATPIVGSTIPIATGAAFALKLQKRIGPVSVVYFGDAATEEGVFHEAVNFAVLKSLPVIFVCEHNFYSVYTRVDERQPASRQIYELATVNGVESHHGDGNNAVEVYEVMGRVIDRARQGVGPFLLQFETYRWREHCGPAFDNTLGYREVSEFERYQQRDPVAQLRAEMLKEGHASAEELSAIDAEIKQDIDDAFEFAKNSAYPDRSLLYEHVYSS